MTSTATSSETEKKSLFVWREHHELSLLREVITYEPYQYRVGSKERGAAWTSIASHLGEQGLKVNQRSVRERFTRMLTSFKKKEAAEKRASGVDVEYTEKDQALLDIIERMAECDEVNDQERMKESNEKATAEEMRKQAVERLGETRKRTNGDDAGRTPEGKRRRSGDLVEILKESVKVRKCKEEAEQELREQELRLRQQQLASQQQLQQGLLEQQQQFQLQQQALTMAIVNTLSELVNKLKN